MRTPNGRGLHSAPGMTAQNPFGGTFNPGVLFAVKSPNLLRHSPLDLRKDNFLVRNTTSEVDPAMRVSAAYADQECIILGTHVAAVGCNLRDLATI